MTPLLAYLATVIATAAAMCGHATQPFPPLRWWRALQARRARRAHAWPVRPRPRRLPLPTSRDGW